MPKESCLLRPKINANARLRLFCFPYAGGSAATYLPWAKDLPAEVELVTIQPPGRSSRIFESPHKEMKDLVEEIMGELSLLLDKPYVLLGHSLGSRVAFEVAKKCQQSGLPLPVHFIASGSRSAHLPLRRKLFYDLPDKEFIEEIKLLEGTPIEIIENEELMDLFLPVLRADFEIADTYCTEKSVVNCPITVFGGEDDGTTTVQEMEAWQELFASFEHLHSFPGGHFFIDSHRSLVVNKVNNILGSIIETELASAVDS